MTEIQGKSILVRVSEGSSRLYFHPVPRTVSNPSLFINREFKIPRWLRPRKRRLNSEFAFFQSLSWLLLLIIFNNYLAHFLKKKDNQMRITRTRLLCEMQANSFWAEFLRIIFKFRKERKISRRLFTSFIKREFRHLPLVVAVTVKKWTNKRDARAELLFGMVSRKP